MPDPRLGYRLVVRMTTADRERIERAARDRWNAAKLAAPRKPYTRPTVTIGPRDEEDIIEALCALNPYM